MASTISTGPLARACGVLACSGALTIGLTASAVGAEVSAFESIPPGEAAQIDETAAIMIQLQDKRKENDLSQDGRLLRGVHPKSHGCVKAEFVVNSDIEMAKRGVDPRKYRVGLFAKPEQKYEAWIRYSNAAALRENDLKAPESKPPMPPSERENGSRGMAIKILDVAGPFLDKDNGRQNQDFLMINTPEFAFSNVHNYLRLNKILMIAKKGDNAGPFFLPLFQPLPAKGDSTWGDFWVDFSPSDRTHTENSFAVIQELKEDKATVGNPLQVQYFGAAPFLFGDDRAMKVSAAPCKKVEQPTLDALRGVDPPADYLKHALTRTMKGREAICLDFKIQVRGMGLDASLIENASTMWPGELTSYVDVARITIPVPQEPDTQEAIDNCEKLAFTPWHSLEAHRPIGGINRLRQKVYYSSAKHRGAISD